MQFFVFGFKRKCGKMDPKVGLGKMNIKNCKFLEDLLLKGAEAPISELHLATLKLNIKFQ